MDFDDDVLLDDEGAAALTAILVADFAEILVDDEEACEGAADVAVCFFPFFAIAREGNNATR
jgi:hypothetical protein